MAQIASAPFILRDIILTLDATDTYEAHVNRVFFNPQSNTVTWQGLTPSAKFTGQTEPTWTLELAGVQDWETANSLAQFLTDNAGEEIAAKFSPQAGSGLSEFTATVIGAPVAIGGDVNTVPQFSVTLGVVGQPVKGAQA